MPPRQSVAAPSSQPIGNVVAAAPTREIKLPPFEEDTGLVQPGGGVLPPARRHGPDVLVLLRAVGTDAIAEKTGKGHPISPEPAPERVGIAEGAAAAPI